MDIEKKKVRRPWGEYLVLYQDDISKTKKIKVDAGKRISLQSHKQRDEYWIIVAGKGVLQTGSIKNKEKADIGDIKERPVFSGSQIKIPAGMVHRIEAITDLTFIEVQLGDCFEEDIKRYQDDYGRM